MSALILLFFSFSVAADPLSWTAPTERINDDPLPADQIAGYKIFGYQSKVLVYEDYVDASITSVDIQMPAGVYYFNLTTVDTDGRETPTHSNSKRFKFITAPPKAPVVEE